MTAITDKTRKMLWGRSGGVCSICKKQLFEDEGLSDDPSVLGQECHIVGERNSADSPRGLDPMPEADRNLYDNLILLCRDHHKIIDDQPAKYTIAELHRIKNAHIMWVRQTLGFDEARQLADETYLGIVQEWARLAGLSDWDDFTYLVIGGDSPTVKVDQWERLEALHEWLFKRLYPGRYVLLDNAFENFRRVLHDFRSVFTRHAEPPAEGDRYLRTKKFYQIKEWNEPLYDKLGRQYDEHVNLLADLAIELTRSANYICDLVRQHVYRSFRIKDGLLVVQTGTWQDGVDRTVRVAYRPGERADIPYPGLAKFMTVRCERDFYFGPPKD